MFKILTVDESEEHQDILADRLQDALECEIYQAFSEDQANDLCAQQTFDVIVLDPMLPAKFNGHDFVEKQRQFYSINIKTPIILFTEDIEFVNDLANKFSLHIESKIGDFKKVLNAVKLNLGVI